MSFENNFKDTKILNYGHLAEIYHKNKNYDLAFNCIKEERGLLIDNWKDDLQETVVELNTKYETIEKEQEIASLKITKEKIDHLAQPHVTDREYEILECMIRGMPNKEIPEKLFISMNTLKYRIKNLFVILEVSSRAEALQKIINLLTAAV